MSEVRVLVAPPFPRTLAELDPWGVFADHLIERGDRLGNHLAFELSLPAEPTPEQLATFHKAALRVCKVPRPFSATWLLGHVHSLALTPELGRAMPPLDGDSLPELRDLLGTPALERLEQLSFAATRTSIGRRWHEAMTQLPKTCRRFELHANRFSARDAEKVLEGIPAQVEVLRLLPMYGTDPSLLVSDHFEWVDLRGLIITPALAQALASALASTTRVKLRVGTTSDRSLLEDVERVVVGGVDDAALIADDERRPLMLFERATLEQLQQRHGIVPVRALLTRALNESHRLGRTLDPTTAWSGDGLLLRAEGKWWARAMGEHAGSPWLTVDGAPLTATPVPLSDGARIEIDGRGWTFYSRLPHRPRSPHGAKRDHGAQPGSTPA